MTLDALGLYHLARRLKRGSIPALPGALLRLNGLLHRVHLALDAQIDPEARLGYDGVAVVVESGASVGGGSLLCQNVTVEAGASIARDVLVGAGAVIRRGIQVGNGARIGANAVVEQHVPPGAVAVGIPARLTESLDVEPLTAHPE